MIIVLSRHATKQINNLPVHIYRKYLYWVDLIKSVGLYEARKYKGFHDEPLKGKHAGQHSVRLSKQYRLIYCEMKTTDTLAIHILEVNKHEYKK